MLNKIRKLRFTQNNHNSLVHNKQHQFANNHALNIFVSDSVYSFIPKNACSTMKLSIAIGNGLISDPAEYKWQLRNIETLTANLRDLITAKFTFVILRNPYLRIASTYLDKIINKEPEMWFLISLFRENIKPDEITFENFVKLVCNENVLRSNNHWRPQIDFLVYSKYDAYIQFEKFNNQKNIIEKNSKIKIIDIRKLTQNDNSSYKKINDNNFAKIKPSEILDLRGNNCIPSLSSLHNDETRKIISKYYCDDIYLYNNIFKTDCSNFFND